MSFQLFLIFIALVFLIKKAVQIGSEQLKVRLNDIFQVLSCVIIPGIGAIIFARALIQVWYFKPYQNIFENLMPLNFCAAVLIVIGVLAIT